MAVNYEIDYNDKRFTDVENDKKAELNEVDTTYGNMISNSDKFYQEQIDATKDYENKQLKNQQDQTDFAIEKIEQQMDQAHKDYIKEQSGAYVDWQKQSNQYGVNAEKVAAAGIAGSGYSESSQVSMYNTYQNRVTAARESYNQAVLNYNNAINDAILQNSVLLAEIAYNSLQKQLELSLQGFQYKNSLIIEKTNAKREISTNYWNRYQDVLGQINAEHQLDERVRQHDESLAEEKRQADLANERALKEIAIAQAGQKLDEEKFAYEKSQDAKAASYTSSKSSGSSKSSSGSKSSNTTSATAYLNSLIASGASKDKVANEIAIALREGAITKAEAQKLRNTFTPRGHQY